MRLKYSQEYLSEGWGIILENPDEPDILTGVLIRGALEETDFEDTKRYPSRLESRAGFFASTRDECLSPRVRLECNPEILVGPGSIA